MDLHLMYSRVVVSLAKIKNELSQEEHDRAVATGDTDPSLLEMTQSLFVITGLELQETQ
jgi:hypothetical protein